MCFIFIANNAFCGIPVDEVYLREARLVFPLSSIGSLPGCIDVKQFENL